MLIGHRELVSGRKRFGPEPLDLDGGEEHKRYLERHAIASLAKGQDEYRKNVNRHRPQGKDEDASKA